MLLHYLVIYPVVNSFFLTLLFYKVVWQHVPGVAGFLITVLLTANLPENQPVKEF